MGQEIMVEVSALWAMREEAYICAASCFLPAPAASGSLRYGAFDFVLRTLNPNLKLSPNPEPLTWVLVGYEFTFLV